MKAQHCDSLTRWKQERAVYLWRYIDNTRNYPGWHLSVDRMSAESLLDLCKALEQSREPAHRTLEVSPPTPSVLRVPNNQGGDARWRSPTKWRVAFAPGPDNEHLWEFPVSHPTAVLRVGSRFLGELVKGLNDVIKHDGDYSIGGHSKEPPGSETALWFWWQ